MKKYCIVTDNSGEGYVVPTERRKEWYLLDAENTGIPSWAVHFEGGLVFENPTDFGKSCFPKELHSTTLLEEIEAWLCFNKEPCKEDISHLHNTIKKHLEIDEVAYRTNA